MSKPRFWFNERGYFWMLRTMHLPCPARVGPYQTLDSAYAAWSSRPKF